eukprot:1150291-Pelagomonas_calceolata.AAC.1
MDEHPLGSVLNNQVQTTPLAATHISVGQGLQEVGLATTVLSNQTVAAADGQLDGAVADELIALDGHGEAGDLDIPVHSGCRQTQGCLGLVPC